MIITKSTIMYYIIAIILILLFFNVYRVGSVVEQIQYTECIVNCIDVISSSIIFYNMHNRYKGFLILPLSMIFLLLMDIEYLATFYFNIKYNFVIYFMGNVIWYVLTVLGLVILLLKFVYGRKESYLLLTSFLFITLVIVFYFAPNYIKYLDNPYYSEDLTSHIIIFYLCILLIIATQNKYVLLAISGLCIVEIGNFAMTECYLENTLSRLVYGEFCFFMGLLILSIGMLNIIRCKLYNPENWFFNSKTIRNRFSFLIFSLSIWSFIIACIVMKQLSGINNATLVFIPAIGMFYSMFTAVLSVIISKQMEKPFLGIQAKIKSLFNADNKGYTENINLIEFQQLNDFITESYEYKTSLEKHIVSMAMRIAHDIKSPLQIIENLLKSQAHTNDKALQGQFLKQINKINYISKSLLNENKKIIEADSYGCQSLYCIIADLIVDKQIEWNLESSIVDLEYRPNQIIWLNSEQSKIKNTISNLLNNAFEASTSNLKNIKLVIDVKDNDILIYIQDFGSGIDKKDLKDILNGKSLKINGNGIGLSTAQKFMCSIRGTLTIDSELNQGTTITLTLPKLPFSEQFATVINIITKKVIIVDDDPTIINFWQEYFLFNAKHVDVMYFVNFTSLKDHLSQASVSSDVSYLLDYNILGEKLTGIDIIKQNNLQNVYLITNYAEDVKLQDEIKSLALKLVPKSMLQIMRKNKAILCLRHV